MQNITTNLPTFNHSLAGTSGGFVFGLSLNKCLENERIRQREAAERDALALAAASTPSGEDGEGSLSRKSSQAGSHASFTSFLEGAKQVSCSLHF